MSRFSGTSWAEGMEAQPKRSNLVRVWCPCGRKDMLVHKRHVGARLVSCGRRGCK